jgi:glutamate dehydrogenase
VRNSFGLIQLNTEIDALDNKVPGDTQLSLYAAVQNLLIERLVWFIRNVDVTTGLADVIKRYQAGIAEVSEVLERVLPKDAEEARNKYIAELTGKGVPDALAKWVASLPILTFAPDIVLVSDRTGKSVADVAATYFIASAYFRLDKVVSAAREIRVSDYFDRLALDRSLNSIEDAHRRLTAEMMAGGASGEQAVAGWIKPRAADVERIRSAVHEIADSGLTLSKLAVAASMLGDLVKG